MKRTAFAALAAIAVLCVASPTRATSLTPGTSVTTPDVSFGSVTYDFTGGTVLASLISEVPKTASGSIDAILTTVVVKNSSGTLDFLYQLTNTGTDPLTQDSINRSTVVDFAGWTTNVQFGDATGTGNVFVTPTTTSMLSGDRSAGVGGTIGWSFGAAGSDDGLALGGVGYVQIVRTDAQYFEPGSTYAIDGGILAFNSFAPTVPEPTSLAIAGLGALGLIGFGLRRRKSA